MATFQLKTSSIEEVPLQSYNKEFTFIVNGEEFYTSKVESDLLSAKINKIHLNDSSHQWLPFQQLLALFLPVDL